MEQGRSISLEKVRADGWLNRLSDDSPNFARLCEEVGERVVAYSIVAGARIVSLAINEVDRSQSVVEFVTGEGEEPKQMALVDFQQAMVAALKDDPEAYPDVVPADEPSPEALQELIGFRYVLLAALYDWGLLALVTDGEGAPSVRFYDGDKERELSLEAFREELRGRVQLEKPKRRTAPFSLDLGLVEQAEKAAEVKDYDEVFNLLGAWPGPLSLLLRSAEAARLAPDVRGTFARGLGVLGSAYAKTGQFDWAQEVIRLGIQWGQDSAAASELFRRLGEACMDRERFGEAIGLLRRAMAIGEPRERITPHLARCYADRKRWVASLLCAEEAVSFLDREDAPADPPVSRETLTSIEADAKAALGEHWLRFRQAYPVPWA